MRLLFLYRSMCSGAISRPVNGPISVPALIHVLEKIPKPSPERYQRHNDDTTYVYKYTLRLESIYYSYISIYAAPATQTRTKRMRMDGLYIYICVCRGRCDHVDIFMDHVSLLEV